MLLQVGFSPTHTTQSQDTHHVLARLNVTLAVELIGIVETVCQAVTVFDVRNAEAIRAPELVVQTQVAIRSRFCFVQMQTLVHVFLLEKFAFGAFAGAMAATLVVIVQNPQAVRHVRIVGQTDLAGFLAFRADRQVQVRLGGGRGGRRLIDRFAVTVADLDARQMLVVLLVIIATRKCECRLVGGLAEAGALSRLDHQAATAIACGPLRPVAPDTVLGELKPVIGVRLEHVHIVQMVRIEDRRESQGSKIDEIFAFERVSQRERQPLGQIG